MKKITALALGLSLLITSAHGAPLYSYTTDTYLTKSIVLSKTSDFYSDYNISYNCIMVDLNDENTSLELLKASNIDKLATVSTLAQSEENVIAALNADFFSSTAQGALSLGVEIKDGQLIQSSIEPETMATVMYDEEKLAMAYLDLAITVKAPNGESARVVHLNKHTQYYGNLLMYTSEFNGGYSPAPGGEVVEVVVSDGKICEFRRNMPPVEIPEDGCVFVVSEGVSMFFANNFAVGDDVEIDYSANPSLESVSQAFGGGAFLVNDGKVPENFSHVVSGYHPRSALGIDESGKILYLVAVDGRQDMSRGMTMTELAQFMKSLGCYNAVNLDGGGSTNMVASDMWHSGLKTVNSPSENRKVINAVGVTYDAPLGEVFGIEIETEKETVYKGESISLRGCVFDENMRPLDEPIVWSATNGHIENDTFYASDKGVAVITAKSGGKTVKKKIQVWDEISGIETNGYLYMKEGTEKDLSVKVFDSYGNVATVSDSEEFAVKSSNEDVVTADGFKLKAVGSGKSIVSVSKDGVKSYVSVLVDDGTSDASSVSVNSYIPIPDNKYAAAQNTASVGDNFRIGTMAGGTKTLMGEVINSKMEESLAGASYYKYLGKEKGFSVYEDKNALYLHLNTEKGGIRASDSNQWNKITEAVSNTDKDDIFITSTNSVFGSSDFENKVFRDYFSDLSDKNVWVITTGERNTYSFDNGIHYFTVANHQKEEFVIQQLENYKYLEFTFGKTTTFQWKGLY